MTDLRQAAQQALEALEHCCFSDGLVTDKDVAADAILAIKQALEQPEQEPCVGKDPRCPCQDGGACHYKDCVDTKARPVAQRTWVGLDEDEIREIYGKDLNYRDGNYVRYAKSVEAKLKERNT